MCRTGYLFCEMEQKKKVWVRLMCLHVRYMYARTMTWLSSRDHFFVHMVLFPNTLECWVCVVSRDSRESGNISGFLCC